MLFTTLIALFSIPALCTAQNIQSVMSDQPDSDSYRPETAPSPSLADLLTVRSSASIWYDYAREVAAVSTRLSDTSSGSRSTLFVPVNKVMLALHRKPHQGPEGDEVVITDEKTRIYVERWVSAHIVPIAPIDLSSQGGFPTLLDGRNVSFTRISQDGQDWEQYVVNPNIHITGKAQASNGDIYFIDGVLDV